MVALCGSVLVPVTAGAHGPTFTPRTETRRVAVYKMVPQPDVWGVVRTEDVFEDRQVQVGTEDVFEDRQVKIGTQPVQVGTERVKVGTEPVYGYKTELVKVVTYEERLTPVYGYRSVQYPCPPPDRPCYRRERYVTGYEPRTVAVVKWEWQRVRVQTGTRDVFETRPVIEHHDVFETRRVKVGTRPVFETRSIKTGTRDVMGWIPQPDKREFSHYKTQTFVDPNPDNGTYTHDPTEHTCPDGQYKMAQDVYVWSTPDRQVSATGLLYAYGSDLGEDRLKLIAKGSLTGYSLVEHWRPNTHYTLCGEPLTLPTNRFVEHADDCRAIGQFVMAEDVYGYYVYGNVKYAYGKHLSHVSKNPKYRLVEQWTPDPDYPLCGKPLTVPDPPGTGLAYLDDIVKTLVSSVQPAIEASGDFLVKTIDKVPGSDIINLVLCSNAPEAALAGVLITNREHVKRAAEGLEVSRKAFAKSNLAAFAINLTVETVYCSALKRAGDTDTDDGDTDDDPSKVDPPTTTPPKVDPPTTTPPKVDPPKPTVNPFGLPVVSQLPSYDHTKYALKFSESLTPQLTAENCTPWVYWAQFSRTLWKCLR